MVEIYFKVTSNVIEEWYQKQTYLELSFQIYWHLLKDRLPGGLTSNTWNAQGESGNVARFA